MPAGAPRGREPTRPDNVVQLRVHGVSAASVDQVLDRPLGQVAGDRSAGFYRPRPAEAEMSGAGGATVEAYRWGNLPAGTVVRTLSLLFLLPFMLLNVAVWMRPGKPASDAVVRSLCRVLGLTLTVLYVLAAVGVALDLIAWQCMSSSACLSGRSWLSWLGERSTGVRLAVLALVPAAAIGLLWWGSTRPGRPFIAFRPPESSGPGAPLSAVGQWDAEPLMGRLRSIHIAAAFATLDGSLLIARAAQGAVLTSTVLAVMTGALLAACVALLCVPALVERAPENRRLDSAARMLRTIAIALTIVIPLHVAIPPARWHEGGTLPGYGATLTWLFVAHAGLLAALAAVLLSRRVRWPSRLRPGRLRPDHLPSDRQPSDGRPPARQASDRVPFRGLGALVIAATGASLAVAFSAGLVYRVADFLDRGASTGEEAVPRPPLAYSWAIYGFCRAVLVTLIVAGLVTLISRRSRTRVAAAIVARDFPDPPAEAAPRLEQVRAAIVRARFTELLLPLTVVYASLAGLGAATAGVEMLGQYPGTVIERNARVPAGLIDFGIALGDYLISAILLGLVIGGIFAYRSDGFRRHVGVLWDLATFWPRAAHPFAPPCYAERAVPELSRRITYLVESGNAVLVAGYSQGSVLVAATLLQLPPHICDRVALLTYNSPLRRLYARLFPAYINDDMLREVGGRVGWRWLNLWRDTDPIGGWIFSARRPTPPTTVGDPAPSAAVGEPVSPAAVGDPAELVDRRLRDPSGLVAPPGDSVPPPIRGHSPCAADDAFAEAARDLAARLRVPTDPGPHLARPPTGG